MRIEADAVTRKRRALPADVPGGAAVLQAAGHRGRRIDSLPRAEATIQRGALAHPISGHARFRRGALDKGPQRRQLRAIGGREILLDGLGGLDDVGVRVEDSISCPCHRRFSLPHARVITSTSAGRPSSLTTRTARCRAGPTASAVSIGPAAWMPNPCAIRARSGAGLSIRIPTTLFSAGRPRALAIASWCSSSLP